MSLSENILSRFSILLVRKTLCFQFVDANSAWIKAANFKSSDHFIGLTDEDTLWAGDIEKYIRPHEIDAVNGLNYAAIRFTVLEDHRPAWLYNYRYLDRNEKTGEQFLQVIAHEVTNPQWVQFLNRMKQKDRYGLNQYFIGKPAKEKLSAKEQTVLFLLMQGKTAKEIALILNRSQRTVESHLASMKDKLDCKSKSQLIEYAFVQGYAQLLPFSP